MPDRLSTRLALAFIGVALVTVIATGATLFVALRGLHQDAAIAALSQTSQPLAFQLRAAALSGDLRSLLTDLRQQVAGDGVSVDLLTGDGRVVDLAGEAAPVDRIALDPSSTRGTVTTGTVRFADGRDHDYAATILRGPNAAGPARAIVLSQLDTSAGDALRDLARTLLVVVILVAAAGVPIAYLLGRSVTGPLRRLARATADLPTGDLDPLPLEGPAEVRELTSRFNAMAAELSETRARESRMLADLRHDLRTPLTVIGGFSAALADGTAVGDDAATAARAIGEEAARLERLVAELEATERLRDGPDGIRPERLDAGRLIRDTVVRFGPAAAGAGIELSVVPTDADVDLTFAADRLAVERILGNLVGNALAVVRDGGHIWLAARSVASVADVARPGIALSVTDDGPGFPPGDLERVFQRFFRSDPSRAGSGNGLGLSIVRELARAHGGDALAENVAPHGARLSVILPETPILPGD